MSAERAQQFLRANHRAVLATIRADGQPQMSPVLCAVDADGRVLISTRETAVKTRNLRRDSRAFLCVFTDRFFGDWIQAEGTAEVISLPDAMELLVEYYRTISGEHPDWSDYRAAMVRDRRVIIRVTLTRTGPTISG
ncbi:MAG TPA: PPOX class F420-dependent oxidoreductase [Streptosporangiaceae bacterium]|jgi:PPOX class probable F420-dependent enzyme|nr:PPOX class F420-dependent oxidoreductase [Streptosporangiaceae bacterium]